MKKINLRVIPVLQVLIAGIAMMAISYVFPTSELFHESRIVLSGAVLFVALFLLLWSGGVFRKYKTTVHPQRLENTSYLVTGGIYRYSRNPMYLSFLLILISWGIYLGSLLSFLVIPIFIWFITKYQILPEEQVLEKKFQDTYREYKRNVRRWI